MQGNLNQKIGQASKWSIITEIICKLIAPVTNMILARLLAPEAFGAVATLTMVVSFAEVFTDAGFQKFIVQHPFDNQEDLDASTNVAFWTNLGFSLLIWLGIACFATPIADLVGSSGSEAAIIIMSLEIPVLAFSSIQMARYRKSLDFKSLFVARLVTSLIPLVITIPLAILFRNYWALVWGTLAKDIANAIILTVGSPWKPRFSFCLRRLKEMFSFSLWSMAENVSNWMTNYIGTFIVGKALADRLLGLYKTTMNTSNSYIGLIVAATTPVLFSALSNCQDDEKLYRKIFFRFQRMAALLVFPLGCGSFVFRELVTVILLGEQWMDTADFMGLWTFISAFAIIFSQFNSELYRSKGKPILAVIQQLLQLFLLVPTLLWGVKQGYETLTVARSLVRVSAIVISAVITRFAIGIRFSTVLKNVWPALLSAAIMALAGVGLRMLWDNLVWDVICVLLCILVYAVCMLALPAGRRQLAEVPILQKILRLKAE